MGFSWVYRLFYALRSCEKSTENQQGRKNQHFIKSTKYKHKSKLFIVCHLQKCSTNSTKNKTDYVSILLMLSLNDKKIILYL